VSARGWDGVDPELRAIIERSCTPEQIEVLKLKAAGVGAKRSGHVLGKDESTIRGLLHRAERRIRAEVAAQRGIN